MVMVSRRSNMCDAMVCGDRAELHGDVRELFWNEIRGEGEKYSKRDIGLEVARQRF